MYVALYNLNLIKIDVLNCIDIFHELYVLQRSVYITINFDDVTATPKILCHQNINGTFLYFISIET